MRSDLLVGHCHSWDRTLLALATGRISRVT
jgi:hypothetical protein